MYKRYILLLIIMITLPAMSQVGELRNNFAIGFNGGINYSNVSFTPKIKQSGLMGFGGGITARYISEKYFAMICGLQVELNYTQRGWKELIEDDSNDEYSRSMNYLEIPFLAHLAFGKERGARFFINLGPQIAFLLNESEKFSDPFTDTSTTERPIIEQYHKDAEKKFDYGIVGGLGLEIRTKAGNFLLEGRYYFGLADIFNNTKKDFFSRSAHTTILGRVSYLFDLKK
ncbi:porin family protein [Bacteroides sp. 519]|uniref:porin family protein n=1 Tax=Bacteroides sp. 519 TaxID=2302937 RepID=UPI0013D5F974|nr:porin family protein [Bacteroides sp. 519]NDV58564.1 PorT family protein [Bacteroides sp. 519]